MKKYVKPMMDSEIFVANEYVSACYVGSCNIDGEVYLDTNNNGVYDKGTDQYKYTNDACKDGFTIRGVDSAPGANAFVVGEHTVYPGYWDSFLGIPFYHFTGWPYTKTEPTPVYNFNGVHITTLDAIVPHEKPNHS